MKLQVTRNQQIFVSYAILAVLVMGLAVLVLRPPIARRIAFADQLETLRITYGKSLESIARSEAVAADATEQYANSDMAMQFYRAETAALAGAVLQNQLQTVIQAEGGILLSSAFRQSSEDLPVAPVSVSVRLQCSVESLLRIMHSLEGRSPTLFLENIVIQSRHRSGLPLRSATEELDVELDVTGYLDRSGEV